MAKVKIRDLQEGMILADDVLDQNGMLILPAGQNITGKHLRTFKAWGIPEVDVEGNNKGEEVEEEAPANNLENVSTEVKREVEGLFRYTDPQHPAVAELMELCIMRKMASL